MIKALIVEDEVLARLGLHQLVDWNALGFELLEDARDGNEAIECIEREHPQLVLLDLNLPKINGLQIQKYIASIAPHCYVVVVSCNEDFAIVKDVMRQGAFDFLRKLNLTSEELTRVLTRCRMEIEKDATRSADAAYRQALRYEDMVSSHSSWFLGENCFAGLACVAVPGQSQKTIVALAHRCKESLAERQMECQLFLRGAQCFYLLMKQLPVDFDCSAWRDSTAAMLDLPVYLGLTPVPIQNHRALIEAAALCEQIFLSAFYGTEQRFQLYTDRVVKPERFPFDFREDQARFQEALRVMSEGDLLWAVSMLFDRISKNRQLSVTVLRRIFMDVLSLYSTAAQKLGYSLEEIEIDGCVSHYQTVITLDSLCAVRKWFEFFSRKFIACFYIPYKSSRSEILRKALNYVEDNLSSSIQLCTAARSINVSETYLSSMFKKEIGQNFISYIHQRKMEKAKGMLEQGQLVREVSDQLGYKNSTYFSKVFKKAVGVAPDAWRKQALKETEHSADSPAP